jgi:2-dehydropantoate 2-reductase
MKALIVGAGAVGQVYGRHLALGGADVAFYVKPKYADECRRGFTMYKLRSTAPVRLDGCDIVTTPDEAAKQTWDQIYLAVSSPALRAGDWLGELGRATGDATVVKLQPGLHDRSFVSDRIASERIVDGQINFLSYHAPLPNETRFAEPGMAYWFFPGGSPFSGPPARVDRVIAALRAGKFPAKRARDVSRAGAYPSAILCTFVLALEASGWSFRTMRSSGNARLGRRAGREAIGVVARELGASPPLPARMLARMFGFVMTRLAPAIIPCDFETYLRVHFTKVGDQMRLGMANYVEVGRNSGLDIAALDELTRQLPPAS